MAVLGFLFFAAVFAVSLWAIAATLQPRLDYIASLLNNAAPAVAAVPVAQRRRVRRLSPLSYRSEIRMIRAAA